MGSYVGRLKERAGSLAPWASRKSWAKRNTENAIDVGGELYCQNPTRDDSGGATFSEHAALKYTVEKQLTPEAAEEERQLEKIKKLLACGTT